MDLHEAAQELYAVLPRDFTSARRSLVRAAKEDGNKELAQEIGRLPKPAAGAWAINMLAAHRPEVIDGVVRFGASLRAAQEESDAAAFRELSQQRQGQLTSAVHAAKDLADELGAPLSAAAASDVEQTLRAAMADAGAARAVGTGRLVRGLSGSGFESVDLTDAVAAASAEDIAGSGSAAGTEAGPAAEPVRKKAAAAKEAANKEKEPKEQAPKEQATSLADRRAAKRQAALKQAQDEFQAADREAQDAEKKASEAWEAVNELARRRSDVEAEIAEVKKRLASLEADLIGLARDADSAESGKKLAVRTATQLRRSADQAQRRVDRLG
jgi:DNA repair exonuclease SbcCD ATPase subunit